VHDTSRWGAKSLRLRSRASPCCFVTYLFCWMASISCQ
jgi:hypothetical protein